MAELTIDAGRHRGGPAQERRGLPPVDRAASRSAGCSRSATASRASPGLPNAAVNELLEFEGGALGLALNLEEDNDRCGGARQGRRGRRGPARHRDRPHPLDPRRRRAARPRRQRARCRRSTARARSRRTELRRLEVQAPGITGRKPVHEPLQTGIKAIDAMTPDRPGSARADHRRPQDRQDHGRDRHDPEPEGSGREVHLRGDRAEGLDRRADRRDAARARRARVHGRGERTRLRRSGVQVPRAVLRLRDGSALDGERRARARRVRRPVEAGRGVPPDRVAAAPPAGPRGVPRRRLLPPLAACSSAPRS